MKTNYFTPADKHGGVVDGGVAHPDHLPGLVLVLGADVQETLVQLQLAQVGLLLGDNDAPHAVLEADGGVGGLLGADAPQAAHPEEALLFDVGDDEADGVHVGGEHHPGALPPLMDHEVAQGVGAHLVGQGLGQAGDDLPDAPLVPRGAVGGV